MKNLSYQVAALVVVSLGLSVSAAPVFGQSSNNQLNVAAGAWASAATNGDLRPLLSYSNEWGKYTQYDQGEISIGAKVDYAHQFANQNISFRAGLAGQLSSDSERTMLHEFYADFDLWMFDVKMGLENYTPIESNTDLSVGSYLMSNNARPVPRAWVGILDYWSLPFGKLPVPFAKYIADLAQIRGGVSFGWVDDEGNATYTDNALLHEKFVYARVGALPVKPYAGLYHSVLMGGTMADGTKIPVDFWASFFGRGGSVEKFGTGMFRGETTNAAGGHQGMWDFGFDFDFSKWSGKFYYQRPFADNKAQNPWIRGIRDFTAGFQFHSKRMRVVQDVAVEYMTTKWQGDEGFPDPLIPTQHDGMTYFYPGDYPQSRINYLVENVLIKEDVEKWQNTTGKQLSSDTFLQFCIATYNRGLEYGGRTLYLTNGFYPQGWTRAGLSTGNALMHTCETVSRYAPEGTMPLKALFPNMGVRAVNVGIKGEILPDGLLTYSFRLTSSRNYGNYREKYIGNDPSSSWEPQPNYYFATPKNETYTKLDLHLRLRHGLSLGTNFAYDFGDLYHSFAFRAGVRYSLAAI